MKDEKCKGCKRECSKDRNVLLYFCRKCKSILPISGDEDYYERNVK